MSISVFSSRWLTLVSAAAVMLASLGAPARAEIDDPQLREQVGKSIDAGLKWLRAQQQESGSWEHHPGITALVLTAYARSPRRYAEADGPFVRRAAEFLRSKAREDGAIFDRDLPAYNTSIAVMALCAIGNPDDAATIKKAQRFLLETQADQGEGYRPSDTFFGGIGYGNDERPDLSNLQYALEALHVTRLAADDPAWERAVRFIERCQNRSESNDQEWAANDGGFVYYPGHSMAGGTTSYGSMTYAGMKSMIHAHLDRDDPRVQAALDWIRRHYTLSENPGLGADGLYYYFHTFAKALRAWGEPEIADASGTKHRWADELARTLLRLQHEDGFWVNTDSERWWEGNRVLVTAEALLALEEALAPLGVQSDECPALSAGRRAGGAGR